MTDLNKNERIKKRIEQEKETKKIIASRLLKTLIVIIVLLIVVGQFDKIKAGVDYTGIQIKNVSIFAQSKIKELTTKKEIIQNPIIETGTIIESTGITNNSGILLSTGEILIQTGATSSGTIEAQSNTGELIQKTEIKEEIKKPEVKKEIPKIIRIRDIYNFKNYIGFGNTGKDVVKLQTMLKKYGYYNGEIDGFYSEMIGESLSQFIQAKTGTNISYKQLGPQALKILNNIAIK